jgi:subtilisin family serine protease
MPAMAARISVTPAITAEPTAVPDSPHALVGLTALMAASSGSASLPIAVIDGPVDLSHAAFSSARIERLGEEACEGLACRHGTLVAGLLAASRDCAAPGICPGCPILLRPIFVAHEDSPAAEPEELAAAILEAIAAGARVINLSLALLDPTTTGAAAVQAALDAAMRQGVLVAAAAGNQGVVGSTPITRHPWVIPVVACNGAGQPLAMTNLSASAGRNGLLAPGQSIVGLKAAGGFETANGTSVAVPFVTGALALLASLCPWASAAALRRAIAVPSILRRSVVPPLLDATAAWRALLQGRRS